MEQQPGEMRIRASMTRFISDFKLVFILFAIAMNSSCSIYKSEGRKNFETQSPGQIRTLSLVECGPQPEYSQTLSQLNLVFDKFEYTNQGYEIKVSKSQNEIYAQFDYRNKNNQETCTYKANDQMEWESLKLDFFNEVDRFLVYIYQQ